LFLTSWLVLSLSLAIWLSQYLAYVLRRIGLLCLSCYSLSALCRACTRKVLSSGLLYD
jgi:hypothetical protein